MSTARDLNIPKELEKFRVNLLNSAIETAIISPGRSGLKPSVSSSKFAGAPYLPVGAVHPKDVHGRYLLLLAQINLSDIDIGEPFPSEGMLQFFISERCYEYVKINSAEKHFFVRYYPSILNPLQLTKDFSYLATCDYATFPIEKEQGIQFHSVIEPVSATDYRLAHFFNPSLFANEALSRGYDVQIVWCGLDSNSIDMVILPELMFCIFDSTEPHVYLPDENRPGDEIFDIAQHCHPTEVEEHNIKEIVAKYKATMADAKYFAGQYAAEERKVREMVDAALNLDEFNKRTSGLFDLIE